MSSTAIVQMPSAEDLLADPAWSSLKEFLIGLTGLDYYADKDGDLARRIANTSIHRRVAGSDGWDLAAWLRLLRDQQAGAAERDALVAAVTIGETYFFRHREHFDALRDVVLPDLAGRNSASRQIRIWCAGCADGCEPYSLSILLRDGPDGALLRDGINGALLRGWSIPILATDISRAHLAVAGDGRFDEWALRATPDATRARCFAHETGKWRLLPEFRAGISFARHNLAGDAFPPDGHDGPFHLIVCRNVMIYFAPELMRRVIQRFHDCLAPGGWLLVGPSEPNMTDFAAFQAVNAPGVTLYQRPAFAVPPVAAPAVAVVSEPPARLEFPPLPPPAPASRRAQRSCPAPALDDLRALADRGDWEGALRCGRRLIDADKLNPLAHYHYGLALEQAGHPAEAEGALRRAIYLDRTCAPAHFHLGVLLRARGDLRQARRCFANTVEALALQPEDTEIAGAGGATAGELARLARQIGGEGL